MTTCHFICAYVVYLSAFSFRCVASSEGAMSATIAFLDVQHRGSCDFLVLC